MNKEEWINKRTKEIRETIPKYKHANKQARAIAEKEWEEQIIEVESEIKEVKKDERNEDADSKKKRKRR